MKAFGPYTLIRPLGKGGMAEVFLAQTPSAGGVPRLVAVKRLLAPYNADAQLVEMLADEARLSVWLTHPNVVQVFDFGRVEDVHYLTMEFIDGCDVCKLIRVKRRTPGRPLPMPTALYVLAEVAEALYFAHRRTDDKGSALNIIHRDVSPHNVLVSREGHVKLADFGLARATISVHHSHAGVIRGKFAYMPKEQAHGADIDHRIDIFAAGATLYEALTGVRPYSASNLAQQLYQLEKPIPPPSTHVRDIPPEIDDLTMEALSPDVETRYQSAADLADDLRHALSRYSTPAQEAQQLAALVRSTIGPPQPVPQIAPAALVDIQAGRTSLIGDAVQRVQRATQPGAPMEYRPSSRKKSKGSAPAPKRPARSRGNGSSRRERARSGGERARGGDDRDRSGEALRATEMAPSTPSPRRRSKSKPNEDSASRRRSKSKPNEDSASRRRARSRDSSSVLSLDEADMESLNSYDEASLPTVESSAPAGARVLLAAGAEEQLPSTKPLRKSRTRHPSEASIVRGSIGEADPHSGAKSPSPNLSVELDAILHDEEFDNARTVMRPPEEARAALEQAKRERALAATRGPPKPAEAPAGRAADRGRSERDRDRGRERESSDDRFAPLPEEAPTDRLSDDRAERVPRAAPPLPMLPMIVGAILIFGIGGVAGWVVGRRMAQQGAAKNCPPARPAPNASAIPEPETGSTRGPRPEDVAPTAKSLAAAGSGTGQHTGSAASARRAVAKPKKRVRRHVRVRVAHATPAKKGDSPRRREPPSNRAAALRAASKKARPAGKGLLTVRVSEPSFVFLNDRPVAKSPLLRHPIAPGTVRIKARFADGKFSSIQWIEVEAGGSHEVRISR